MTSPEKHSADVQLKTSVEMTVTEHMNLWIREIFEAGAVSFAPDGTATLNKEVREMVEALHALLAGGTIEVAVVHKGGERGDQLERFFDLAWEELNEVRRSQAQNAGNGKYDPVSP